MKRKSLQYLKFTKVSISNLQKIGGRPPQGSGGPLPDQEERPDTIMRICGTGLVTTNCPSNMC